MLTECLAMTEYDRQIMSNLKGNVLIQQEMCCQIQQKSSKFRMTCNIITSYILNFNTKNV